jgi:hypothetical protein
MVLPGPCWIQSWQGMSPLSPLSSSSLDISGSSLTGSPPNPSKQQIIIIGHDIFVKLVNIN